MRDKVVSAAEAVAIIRSGDMIATSGFVGVGTPDEIYGALERRFLETGRPRELGLLFAAAPGDGRERGLNRLAHEGLIARAVGGHWSLVPKLGRMAAEGRDPGLEPAPGLRLAALPRDRRAAPVPEDANRSGFIHQRTDLAGLDERLSAGPIAAYVGFDATADSLHTGHLLPIMTLRWFQRSGHKPIILMVAELPGSAIRALETRAAPSRRRTDRKQHCRAEEVFSRYLTIGDGPTDAMMVDNADWLDPLRYLPFLKDLGTHFTVNRMLSFDSVRQRLESSGGP